MYLSYIAHYLESHQADDFCLMETVAGVSIHFPRCFRWRRSKLAFGQSSSNLIQLARPSVACCGLQDLGLFCHATLPSLFPGLDKADALQYLSPILNLLEVFLSRRLSTAHVVYVVAVSRAGIQYCSDQAEMAAASDMEKSYTLRSAAKQLAFNLASFTWPGWNEPGINLQPLQVEAGLDAARQNLRLALEPDKGDLPLSRAYWMLGGHLLAARALAGAEANFRRAAMYAVRADAPADEMLAHAFASLAYWMIKPQSAGHRLTYEKAWERLAVLKDGDAYQLQLDNARSVFMVEI